MPYGDPRPPFHHVGVFIYECSHILSHPVSMYTSIMFIVL